MLSKSLGCRNSQSFTSPSRISYFGSLGLIKLLISAVIITKEEEEKRVNCILQFIFVLLVYSLLGMLCSSYKMEQGGIC